MTKNYLAALFSFYCFFAFARTGKELKIKTWSLTPHVGWNSWDLFGPSVNKAEDKEIAGYMATNLEQFCREYIVVDIRWYVDNQTTGTYNTYVNSTFIYGQFGRYIPYSTRFTSATDIYTTADQCTWLGNLQYNNVFT